MVLFNVKLDTFLTMSTSCTPPKGCKTEGCDDEASGNNMHCPKHACIVTGCLFEANNTLMCNYHECPVPNCGLYKSSSQKVCVRHRCIWCDSPVHQKEKFCLAHKCWMDDCSNGRKEESRYCDKHTRTVRL